MKATRMFFFAACVFAAASCSTVKEDLPVKGAANELTISAYFDETKSAIQEDGKVFWEPGDAINVFYNGTGSKFVSTLTEAGAFSQFKGQLDVVFGYDEEGKVDEPVIWGAFPYSSANSSDGSSVTVALPALQSARPGTVGKDIYPTVGMSTTPSMAFYGVAGGLRFTLTRSDITSISFAGANGEKVAGKIKVAFENGAPVIQEVSAGASTITLMPAEGETFQAGVWYYIVVAPVALKGGFEMTFNTADKSAKYTRSSEVTISRKVFGSISDIDKDLVFGDKTWSAPIVLPVHAASFGFEIDPKTDKPVIAFVDYDTKNSSSGPLYVYNGLNAAPAYVATSIKDANGVDNNRYTALGINDAGKAYIFTSNPSSPAYGEIYSSSDYTTWTCEVDQIDKTNGYAARSIGCLGNKVVMMTSNNAAGAVPRRNLNVTYFSGTSWTKGMAVPGRNTALTSYNPVIKTKNGVMYVFVTNISSGFSIIKFDGENWTNVKDIVATAGSEYAQYSYSAYYQDMAISDDGQIYIIIGTSNPLGVVVLKYDPEEDTLGQIGTTIPLTDSVSARYVRIAFNANGVPYIAFRGNDKCPYVSVRNEDTWEWEEPVKLGSCEVDDLQIRFNSKNQGFVVVGTVNSSTNPGHVEVFTL